MQLSEVSNIYSAKSFEERGKQDRKKCAWLEVKQVYGTRIRDHKSVLQTWKNSYIKPILCALLMKSRVSLYYTCILADRSLIFPHLSVWNCNAPVESSPDWQNNQVTAHPCMPYFTARQANDFPQLDLPLCPLQLDHRAYIHLSVG